jgi:hypothetical protein
MEFFEFTLKVRPSWDNGKFVLDTEIVEDEDGNEKVVQKLDEDGKDKYKLLFDTDPDVRNIKIQQPFKPQTYSMILRHLGEKANDEAAILIISQYMFCSNDEDKELQKRILNDGRLLFSCLRALLPIFDLCEVELKKD